VLTQVSGQLVRNGIFQDKVFTEAVPSTAAAFCNAPETWSRTAGFHAVNDFQI